jgi:putative peptidoglycan lipid II flippase
MRGLFKSVSLVSGTTLISRVLGFVRDVAFASFFGANFDFDAFLVAFKIPNFMRKLFAEGAFSQAFVPVLMSYYVKHSKEEVLEFIDKVFGNLMVSLVVVSLFVMLFAPYVVSVFAPGYIAFPAKFGITVEMLRITFPYAIFISLTAMLGAIYNCKKKFFFPAICPTILNICSIICACLSHYYNGSIIILAWGILIAGVLQLSFLLYGMKSIQRRPRPKISFKDKGVVEIVKLMSAALFGVSVAQIGLIIDTFLASFLPSGSISWLYYSERLLNLPLALFATAISTVMLPYLASCYAKKDNKEYNEKLDWGVRLIIVISLPAAVGLYVLAEPILLTLFYHGSFTILDVNMSSLSLCSFAIGLPAFMLVKVMVGAFYARKDIKTPVKVAVYALIIDIVLSLLLLKPMAHAGLALAVTASSWLNGLWLFKILLNRNLLQLSDDTKKIFFVSIYSSLVMLIVLKLCLPNISVWIAYSTGWRFFATFIYIMLAIIIYTINLKICGVSARMFVSDKLAANNNFDIV